MKSSQILREAARRVEKGREEYGCLAIQDVLVDDGCPMFSDPFIEREKKAKQWLYLLKPEAISKCGGYWHFKVKGPRIIGLCLAAAIAESEGD